MRIVFSASVLSALAPSPRVVLARSQSTMLRKPSSTTVDVLQEHLAAIQREEEEASRRRKLDIIPGCLGEEDFTTTFTTSKSCTYTNLRDKFNGIKPRGCDATSEQQLLSLLGETDPASGKAKVKELCSAAYENSSEKFHFSEITRKGTQFDNEYYSGGTEWNYEIQTDSGENELKTDAARVERIYEDQAQYKIIDPLPTYLPAFDPVGDGCDLNAAFCCWVQDRQADDNNGNCNTPYESQCIDKDPGDNTNFCYTDHSRSSAANHVDGGFSVFGNIQNGQENIEGAVHCHGFAWGEDASDISGVYKGNNLFFVSMYDHMHQRGYVRNAPGSAMCGCAENMAVVTRADCTEIAVSEKFTFEYNATTATLSGVLVEVKDVNFNSCQGRDANGKGKSNDLEAHYRRLVSEERQSPENFAELQKILVGTKSGNCNNAIINYMREKGILRPSEASASVPALAEADSPMIAGAEAAAPSEPEKPASDTVEPIDIAYEKASEGGDGNAMPEVPTDLSEGEDDAQPKEAAPTPAPVKPIVKEAAAPIEPVKEEVPLLGEGKECGHGWDCMSGRCLGNGHCSAIHKNEQGYHGAGGATCGMEGDPCQSKNDCCDSVCGGNPKVCGGVSKVGRDK